MMRDGVIYWFHIHNPHVACMQLSEHAQEKVDMVGELLIRALAALKSISRDELLQFDRATNGQVSSGIRQALDGVISASPAAADSLQRHGPRCDDDSAPDCATPGRAQPTP